MGDFTLVLPGNIYYSPRRSTCEHTEDIAALCLLLSTAACTVIDQDGIHDAKENNYDVAAMDDFDESESGSCAENYSVDE